MIRVVNRVRRSTCQKVIVLSIARLPQSSIRGILSDIKMVGIVIISLAL
jgi:hypothetical protein